MKLPKIIEERRLKSPEVTPQALAWDGKKNVLWMGSRDLRRIYAIDPENGTVLKQQEAPGIPWAAVALNGELRFTIGEGADDDRYIYRYTPEGGFSKMFACPEFTGSYLSFDGKNLYMSQWYKKRVLKFDDKGNVIREIDVGVGDLRSHFRQQLALRFARTGTAKRRLANRASQSARGNADR